jgi:hypothetical protein
MQAQLLRRRSVEEIGGHGFADIGAQLFPRIGFGKNTFAQRFGDEASVGILRHFKDQSPMERIIYFSTPRADPADAQ